MEGDDELLADIDIKNAPKRDEWMTVLPPERKVRSCFKSWHHLFSLLCIMFTPVWTQVH